MKRSTVRGFGLACLVIGILYTGMDRFSHTESESKEIANYEEKIAQLKSQLKVAKQQLQELENQSSSNSTETQDEPEVNNEPSETTTSTQQENVVEGILYIYSGLTPYEVSKKLEDMGIIKNAVEMELFLAQPEYARSIQKGQFKVNSTMTIEEIANLITGKQNS